MLCEKDNLAGAPERPKSPPPPSARKGVSAIAWLLPVRTERGKRAKTQSRRRTDGGREAEDDSNDPRPIAAPATEEEGEEATAARPSTAISLSLLRFFRLSFPWPERANGRITLGREREKEEDKRE